MFPRDKLIKIKEEMGISHKHILHFSPNTVGILGYEFEKLPKKFLFHESTCLDYFLNKYSAHRVYEPYVLFTYLVDYYGSFERVLERMFEGYIDRTLFAILTKCNFFNREWIFNWFVHNYDMIISEVFLKFYEEKLELFDESYLTHFKIYFDNCFLRLFYSQLILIHKEVPYYFNKGVPYAFGGDLYDSSSKLFRLDDTSEDFEEFILSYNSIDEHLVFPSNLLEELSYQSFFPLLESKV